MIDSKLIDYLQKHMTPERQKKIEKTLEQRTRFITLALEDIYQPHNAAAIMRSCEGFGIQDIHVIENRYEFQKTKGVAMGADKWLNIHQYNQPDTDNTTHCLKTLKEKGYTIAACTLREDAIPLHEFKLDKPLALTLGTELTGLSDTAHDLADVFVYLPMYGFTQSFNISVCAALALYDLRTRLEMNDLDWALSDSEKMDLKFQWLKKSIRAADKIIEEFGKKSESE